MSLLTLEGVVDHGLIRLVPGIQLPDNTKVYVIIPGMQVGKKARIVSPHLVHPEQAADFRMDVSEVLPDANL
jgi:hypothetical protein